MTSTVPLLPPPLAGTRPACDGGGDPYRHTARQLRSLGADVPDAPDAGVPAASRLRLPHGSGAVLDWPAHTDGESDLQARTGLMAVHGRRHGAPEPLPLAYVGTVAATAHVTGLLAAELLRLRSGRRATAHTSAEACALLTVSQYLAAAAADEGEAVSPAPGTATFTSADGVDFEIEALVPELWGRFWTGLDAPRRAISAGWTPFQFRYATARAPLPGELRSAAASCSWADVRATAERSGVGLVRLTDAARRPPGTSGRRPPWTLRPVPAAPPARPSGPAPGADSCVLPLTGLRVLEAGRRIQAPLAAHLLRSLGATVVRVEPPGGDPLRGMPPTCGGLSARWSALNRGKDAVEVDIKSDRGRRDLRDLTRDADVFLHNWAPGNAERLGLDATALARANPRLVYAYTSGWGGPADGLPPGTDFMVQAHEGLTAPAAAPGRTTVASLMTVLDVLGGFLGAQAVTAALLTRERLGSAVAVESSLRAAADLLRGRPRAEAPDVDGHAVTTDLPGLEHDPRLGPLLSRAADGLLTVDSPWRIS
ncbi:CoA transferase [Nocardiopsis sp. EMB25]|uniref:CoA transferase n=1 Tax=Nocardiopsis sp. EMB25 TaxID=2835867 RepID=UPI00228422FF|nr:CoA transferase [Nocardiopsis sp. EMB25]MCY9787442.1 CoA transferase [Nocardiopsis sp. EMB25]